MSIYQKQRKTHLLTVLHTFLYKYCHGLKFILLCIEEENIELNRIQKNTWQHVSSDTRIV